MTKLNIIPNKITRVIVWFLFNIIIFIAVAITNGFIVYFLGLLSSCLLSAWMLTPFVVLSSSSRRPIRPFTKVLLVCIGILSGIGFTYSHPLYAGATLAVVIHEMRVLNRYDLGPIASLFSPVVSLLPIIFISHSSYSRLTLSTLTYSFEPILGYIAAIASLVIVILQIKKDDRTLLLLLGKNEVEYSFERVGLPKSFR